MTLLSRKSYMLGFVLYWLALLLFLWILVPGIWVYQKQTQHSDPQGLSVWSVKFNSCLAGHGYKTWRCGVLDENYIFGKKMTAVFLVVLGTLTQGAACVILVLYNLNGAPMTYHFRSEIAAGAAEVFCLTGVLMYFKYTHDAANIVYGPGIFIHCSGIFVSYLGLLFTGFSNTPYI